MGALAVRRPETVAIVSHDISTEPRADFPRWKVARVLLQRNGQAGDLRAAIPTGSRSVADLDEWRRLSAVAARRTRTVLPEPAVGREDDGRGLEIERVSIGSRRAERAVRFAVREPDAHRHVGRRTL